jgi:uncharacterized membrane protein YhaH (DUF805 family)
LPFVGDLDRSGWWILVFLIPLIGLVTLIIWFCSIATEHESKG